MKNAINFVIIRRKILIKDGIKNEYHGNTTVLPLENENENENIIDNKIEDLYKGVVIFFDEDLRPKTKKQKKDWCDTLDKLIKIDGKSPELIIKIVKKTRMDDFWKKNFMSLMKLRKLDKNGTQYFLRFEKLFTGEIKSEDTVTKLRREMKEIEARQNGNK